MIKRYNQFINEGLMQHLNGPSKEEVWNTIKNIPSSPYTTLRKVCETGLVEHIEDVIEMFKNKYPDEYSRININQDILKYGIDYNQANIVEYALQNNVQIEQSYYEKATDSNNLDIIKLLIKYDKNPYNNYDGLLKSAALKGYEDMTKFYLNNGANPNQYKTLIYTVKLTNNLNIIKMLVENGADIHAEKDEALRFASTYGKFNIVKYFLSKGADIHAQDDTALIWAAEDNHPNVVELLLKNGANIHAQNDKAMNIAIKRNRIMVIDVLNKYMEK